MDYSEYIREIPGADTAVLMIHGIVSSPRCMDWLLPTIPETCSVYNILLPGHGGKVQDFSATSMAQWKSCVAHWMETVCSRHEKVVVMAHSLGTLLSIWEAPKHPQVKAMLLVEVPLKVWVHPRMVWLSLKAVFTGLNQQDFEENGLHTCLGVHLSKKLWLYLGWIPRFWELLVLCRQTRSQIPHIPIPCHVFHGRRDELVRLASAKYFQNLPMVRHQILETAGHFYYYPKDVETVHAAAKEIWTNL